MAHPAQALALGLLAALVGLIASNLPLFDDIEADIGLGWLFALRGPRPAPAEVVVVTIDRESSERLGLRNDPEDWPRSLHARLVRKLVAQGARVIAFDVFFEAPRDPDQDRMFAEALREAGNVVLFEDLRKRLPTPPGVANLEVRAPPLPELARAAAATAPFPLPKVPVKVSQCWLFKSEAGDLPVLPVVVLHLYARAFQADLLRLLQKLKPEAARWLSPGPDPADQDVTALIRKLRQLFRADPGLAQALLVLLGAETAAGADPGARSLLAALIAMYSDRESRYLDFYGWPRSITTIPYSRVLEDSPGTAGGSIDVRDKAVFVGVSERFQPEQKQDGFHTVFSQPDGLDLSGVEIAATVFANLLESRSVRPLDPPFKLLMIGLWGLALGALFRASSGPLSIPVAGLCAGAYLGAAYYLFALDSVWIPLVAPLLVQVPVALLGILLWQYLDSRRERRKIRVAFGYYLPGRVVDELVGGLESLPAKGQLVHGICLASDAKQYTRLSEGLEPDRLRLLLNRYYEVLFEPVRRRGGFISDVVGDAMLALWAASAPDPKLREQACLAALDIMAEVDEFNRRHPQTPLPTRLGLHCGEIMLGNVGAGDHYEYRAVGDIVNTANRIQNLNKQLGTRVLVTKAMLENLPGLITREVGSFCLPGKSRPLVICELAGRAGELSSAELELHARFAVGLEAFRSRRWQGAGAIFKGLVAKYRDGPSYYYLNLCEHYSIEPPPAAWDGVAVLDAA